jgi:glucans biosynthesis protein C
MQTTTISTRQHDLDWIRVIVTLFVFFYHCLMFFNPFPWHVKNNEVDSTYILAISLWLSTWIMPIFFAISGISTFHALKKRNGKQFMVERFARLGIPLLFGVLILSPPQVYIERVTHHQFEGSFLSFFPHYFDGLYLEIGGAGNFAFVGLHLWYLLVLLVFSLLIVPLLGLLKASGSFTFKHYLLLPIILFIMAAFLEIVNLGGWGIPFYFVLFIYGYKYFAHQNFKDFYRKNGIKIGFVAFVTSILFIFGFMKGIPGNGTFLSLCFTYIKVVNSWNWLVFLFFLGDRYLSNPKKGLSYWSQAAMPFYVLHQPIIVGIGFTIYQFDWSIPTKLLFIAIVSFIIIMMFYHWVVRNISPLSMVFGMKGKRKKIENKSFFHVRQ